MRKWFNGLLIVPAVLIAGLLGACKGGTVVNNNEIDLAAELNRRIREPMSDTRQIQVYLATNRKTARKAEACSNRYFTVEFDDVVNFGICPVSVPRRHNIGALDDTEDRSANRNTYFRMGSYEPIPGQKFFQKVGGLPGKEVMLFVHGFNVQFKEAVYRAAQIAYDAKFQGPVVLYTWPAGSRGGFLDSIRVDATYRQNQKNAAKTIPLMADFIDQLSKQGKTVHLMVHSMGHQIALPALESLVQKGRSKIVGELVLNAPDFPAREFKRITPTLRQAARRITLYCSPGDNALVASENVNGNKRIGQCMRVSGVDVINVNEVDAPTLGIGGLGHGYYSGRAILTDLFQVLLGIKVEKRLFIRIGNPRGGEDYVLRK